MAVRRGKSRTEIVAVRKHEDFERVYDLPDPRSYYRALQPLDYRLPAVACGYLARHAERMAVARGKERLRLLDFACGYGANGALLLHELALDDVYAFYAADAEGDAADHDSHYFAARRLPSPAFEIGGIDVAGTALAYARHCGLLHRSFDENLLKTAPSPALRAFLGATDIVLETGGMGELLAPCFGRLLEGANGGRPWFLYSPRGNVDETNLQKLFARRGYRLETCSTAPVRYRRLMNAGEEAEVAAAIRRQGRDPAAHLQNGYFMNPLRLARPEADATALPVSDIML